MPFGYASEPAVVRVVHVEQLEDQRRSGRCNRYRLVVAIPSMMEAVCFPLFKRAAAAVATFELRVRLLADMGDEGTPLQRSAIGGDLTPLIEMICKEYNASDEQLALLKSIASIRNKLFHLELSRVTGRIRPLSEQLKEGGTWMVNLNDSSVEQVSKTKTRDGRIYGWIWESAESGAFAAVELAAEKATALLQELRDKRIAEDLAAAGLGPPSK